MSRIAGRLFCALFGLSAHFSPPPLYRFAPRSRARNIANIERLALDPPATGVLPPMRSREPLTPSGARSVFTELLCVDRSCARSRLTLMICLLLVACSPALLPAQRRPDGGFHLKCGASLEACVQRADELCKRRGFVVISGSSQRKLYGAELGVSQVEVREAELDVACADRRGDLPSVSPVDTVSASAAPAPAPAPAP